MSGRKAPGRPARRAGAKAARGAFRIRIRDEQRLLPISRRGVASLLRLVLRAEGRREAEVSVVFVTDTRIRCLNRRYLGRDRPTDVLAFPQREGPKEGFDPSLLGDVMVSTRRVKVQAREYGQAVRDELALCLIHGLLHLCGWRDRPALARARLQRRERCLLRRWRKEREWSLTKS